MKKHLHYRNVQRFRGELVFKAHRLLYHSTLGLRVTKKKEKTRFSFAKHPGVQGSGFRVQGPEFRVQGSGVGFQRSWFGVLDLGFMAKGLGDRASPPPSSGSKGRECLGEDVQ